MHPVLILRESSKKFANIVEGNNISTQSRRSVSPDSQIDVGLKPATGTTSTSPAFAAFRMDAANGLRSS